MKKIFSLWVGVVKKESPLAVGISLLKRNLFLSLLFARQIRSELKDVKIIFGGPECNNANGKLFLEHNFADAVVLGEGEEALYQTLLKIKENNLSKTAGTIIRKNNDILYGSDSLQLDINTLPLPDFQGFSQEKYPDMILPFAFARGCKFKCKFCTEALFWKKYRQMKVGRAVKFLEDLKAKYNVEKFHFCQSMMNSDLKWLEEFSLRLIKANLKIRWGGFARIHPGMNSEYLETLYKGGCRYFYFGIESGSQRLLNKMNKGVLLSDAVKVIRESSENNIWVHSNFIFGFTDETESDLLQSLSFIIENSCYMGSFSVSTYNSTIERENAMTDEIPDLPTYLKERKGNNSHLSILFRENRMELHAFIEIIQRNEVLVESEECTSIIPKRFAYVSKLHVKSIRYYKLLVVVHLLQYYILNKSFREDIVRGLCPDKFDTAFTVFSQNNNREKYNFTDVNEKIGEHFFTILKKTNLDT